MTHPARSASFPRRTLALSSLLWCLAPTVASACPACAAGRGNAAGFALIAVLMLAPYLAVTCAVRAVRRAEAAEREAPRS